jgi:hypothetical protein
MTPAAFGIIDKAPSREGKLGRHGHGAGPAWAWRWAGMGMALGPHGHGAGPAWAWRWAVIDKAPSREGTRTHRSGHAQRTRTCVHARTHSRALVAHDPLRACTHALVHACSRHARRKHRHGWTRSLAHSCAGTRALTLVTKVLQNLANGIKFGLKEKYHTHAHASARERACACAHASARRARYMEDVNTFIALNQEHIRDL